MATRRAPRRTVPENIRITRVGLVYVVVTLIVGVAATNTGNNALYMVLSVMLGLLAVSGLLSRDNVRHLELAVEPPPEVFAGRPFRLGFSLVNRSRWRPHWLLVLWVGGPEAARLVPYLPAGGSSRGAFELELPTRGRHRVPHAHLSSIFPLGLFRKGMRHRVGLELLVYPRLLEETPWLAAAGGRSGEEPSRRPGWGHELLELRPFRPGDDPRAVHWKQTARTGELIFTEREAERGRRISVVCDNRVGELSDAAGTEEFEHLVSEAATAVCRYLQRGYRVELVTGERVLPYGAGRRQRARLLEHLALLRPLPRAGGPLSGSVPGAARLVLEVPRAAREAEVAG